MLSRRNFNKLVISSSVASLIFNQTGCSQATPPKPESISKEDIALSGFEMIAQNGIEGEYKLKVQGKIPSSLKGILYRNGCSMYERDGVKKNSLIDGDGMISRLEIGDDVTFSTKYVQTKKFKLEQQAGRFLYDTWATRILDNDKSIMDSDNYSNQSSVSIKKINNKLYSFDESSLPYRIDGQTLDTLELDEEFKKIHYHNAHGKNDNKTGEFINFGYEYGRHNILHTYIIKDNKISYKKAIDLSAMYGYLSLMIPPTPYIHDFFVSEDFIIFNLQPYMVDLKKVGFLAKWFLNDEVSIAQSMSFMPNVKNKIILLSRKNQNAKPIIIDSKKSLFFWHTFNASQKGGKIFCDFISYDNSDFFNPHNNPLAQAMDKGFVTKEVLNHSSNAPGRIYRYTIKLEGYNHDNGACKYVSLDEKYLTDEKYSHEFSVVNEKYLTRNNRYGYMASSDEAILNGVSKFDFQENKLQSYFFDKYHICGEFVFCEKQNAKDEDDGYLVATVTNIKENKVFIAIFDAKNIKQGTVARIYLNHNMPLRLHGLWVKA